MQGSRSRGDLARVRYEIPNRPIKGRGVINRHRPTTGRVNNTTALAQGRRRQQQQNYSLPTTCLDVENGPPESYVNGAKSELTYLHVFFVYLNIVGISPYRFDKDNKKLTWAYNVPHYMVIGLAALAVMIKMKLGISLMSAASETTQIKIYMNVFYLLTRATLVIMFAVSLRMDGGRYAKLLIKIDESSFAKKLQGFKQTAVAATVIAIGFIQALALTLNGIELGIMQLLKEYSATITDVFPTEISPNDGTTTSVGTMLLGSLGLVANFSMNLIHQAVVSGLFLAALTLAECCANFSFKQPPPTGLNKFTHGMELWRQYEELKDISKAVNSSIFRFLRFMMLANLFLWPVFVDNCFEAEIGKMRKLGLFVEIVTSCYFFYLANESAKRGDRFRDWLSVRKNRIDMNMLQTDVLLEGQSEQSIGIGRGALYINDALILGYAAAIAAYFLGIVETRQVQKEVELGGDSQCECESAIHSLSANLTTAVEALLQSHGL